MRVLITGATGKIGSRLAVELLAQGAVVRALVRDVGQARAIEDRGAVLIVGDIAHPETLIPACVGVDVIFHLAAYFRGPTTTAMERANVMGAINVAEAALAAGVGRLVFASTGLVYGDTGDRPAREEDDPHPLNAYARSKLAAEQALLMLHQTEGLSLAIVRPAFVYGERDTHLREFLPIWQQANSPNTWVHLIHHADVRAGLIAAAQTPRANGRIYNLADDRPLRVAELLMLLPPPPTRNRPPLSEALLSLARKSQILSTARAHAELGFAPRYPSLADALAAGVA